MVLTKWEIERMARLAQLDLTETEKNEFIRKLNQVLSFVAQLNQLDTTEVEPMTHVVPIDNVFRSDWTGPSLDQEKVLANAPDRKGNFFMVPKILED